MKIQSTTIYHLPITNYHCASGTISTTVESALQIHLFMQNKANFRKSQMNASDLLIREYEQMDTWWSGKNKPKTNPIQTQYKPNTKPIQTQYKAKQTQFKPNSKPIKPNACPPSVWRDRGEKPDFSLDNIKVNFQAQRIDGSVQICYMAETVFFANYSSCSLLRGLKCESWKNLKQLSKMEQFSSVIVFVVI